jgi:murein DD-endopeptidase MepM/ murein hydrolase activator NlpD
MRLFRAREGAGEKGRAERRSHSYTLMIVPSAHSRVRRLVVSERTLRLMVAGAGAAALLVALLGISFVRGRFQAAELERLRAETVAQREKTAQLARGLVEMESAMSRLRKFEARLRTAFDLDRGAVNREKTPAVGGGEKSLADMLSGQEARQADLAGQVDRDLGQLRGRVEKQEQGLSELVSYLEDRRSLMAATPSILPTRGWVTSGYERRADPFTQNQVMHRGLDISSPLGTPIVAPADGVVTAVAREAEFGNLVSVEHGYGFVTRYGHASRVLVRAGQQVRRGQMIALVGNTGKSTGPHLHYEVLRNGVPVDPQDFVIN